jgi:serine/threonine protein phosphatase PrpC
MRNGELQQLTIDDTWVGSLIRSGALTEAQAKTHSMRNVITQAVGSHKDLEVHTADLQLEPDDILMITSDGVHGVVEHAALRSILYTCRNMESAAKQIIETARANGAPDNASCILLRYTADSNG